MTTRLRRVERKNRSYGQDEEATRGIRAQAGLREDLRAGTETPRQEEGRAALRRPGTQRPAPALGPALGARGRRRLLGDPERDPGRPLGKPQGGPHRGPPARVPGLGRRDPEGGVRGRDDDDLGLRHLRAGEVGAGESDGRLRRRAAAGALRALPRRQSREGLDDPPDRPAGARAGPVSGERGADAGAALDPAARRRQVGGRGEVGRGPGDRLLPARAGGAADPQPQHGHRPVPRGAPDLAGAGLPRRRPRRGAGRFRRGRQTQLRAAAAADPQHRRERGQAADEVPPRRLRRLRSSLSGRRGPDLRALQPPPRAARGAGALRRELADAGPLGRPRRGVAGGEQGAGTGGRDAEAH